MKKSFACILLALALPAHAQKAHIADDVYIFYHSGPSNQYKITGRVNSGTPITILKRDPDSKYVLIRMPNDKTGWVAPTNVEEGPSLFERVPTLEANLKNSQAKVEEQKAVIEQLQAELAAVQDERAALTEELRTSNAQIQSLSFQVENMDQSNLMRWFTHGGLVALGGVILGLLLRSFSGRRKPTSSW